MPCSSKLHVMIVGGTFIGKGAEAMMLTVRDAIKAALPEAVLCVTLGRHYGPEEWEAHGFRPLVRRQVRRPLGTIATALAMARLLPNGHVDVATIDERGLFNPFRMVNAVVDVSGFSSSDQFGVRSSRSRWQRYLFAQRPDLKLIFMPQSWGPFRNRWVRLFAGPLVRQADLVFAREKLSYQYLLDLPGVDPGKIVLAPDVAFQFRGHSPETGDRLLAEQGLVDHEGGLVGITPNMRIYERTEGQGPDNVYLRSLAEVVRYFLEKTPCQVVLIPHEQSVLRANDLELCQTLADQFARRDRIFILTGTPSAADVKAVVGRLDFLIASRYHSLVAAMSLRVPTAVIGWAHKYDGLMQTVGLKERVIDPVRQAGRFTTEVIVQAWQERDAIRDTLVRHVPELEKSSRAALDRMVKVLQTGPKP